MFKTALLCLIGVAAVSTQDVFYTVGDVIKKVNSGVCLAFQDVPTDETTSCFSSCTKTGDQIQIAFDVNNYSQKSFNTLEFWNYL